MQSPLIILQFTDCHILAKPESTLANVNTTTSLCKVLKYALSKHQHPNLILITGDLVNNPCKRSYERIYAILKTTQTKTLCLPGNHDDFMLMQQIINDAQVNCAKHLVLNKWQIVCLNSKQKYSHEGYIENDELNFLETKLTQHQNLNAVIAIHHPPLAISSPWLNKIMLKNKTKFFTVLRNFPQVKAIICGHIHQQLETQQEKIKILVSPSTCFQFKPNCKEFTLDTKPAGYRRLSLYPDGTFTSQVYRLI